MKLVFASALLQCVLGAAVIAGAHYALYSSSYYHREWSWTDGSRRYDDREHPTTGYTGWEYERPMGELALSIYEYWLRSYDAQCGRRTRSRSRYNNGYRGRRSAAGDYDHLYTRRYYDRYRDGTTTTTGAPTTSTERADNSKRAADCAAGTLMSHQWETLSDVGRYGTQCAIWLAGCYGALLTATALTALLPLAYRCLLWCQKRMNAALGVGTNERPTQQREENARRYKKCTVFTLAVAGIFTIVFIVCVGQYYYRYKQLSEATWQLWAFGVTGLCLLATYVLLTMATLRHVCTALLCLHVPMAALSMCLSAAMAAGAAAFYTVLTAGPGRVELSVIGWMRPWALLFAIVLSMAALTLLLSALATVDQLLAEAGGHCYLARADTAVETPAPEAREGGSNTNKSATLPQVKAKVAQIATATKELFAMLFVGNQTQRVDSAETEGRSNLIANVHTEQSDDGQAAVETDANGGNVIGVGVNDNVV